MEIIKWLWRLKEMKDGRLQNVELGVSLYGVMAVRLYSILALDALIGHQSRSCCCKPRYLPIKQKNENNYIERKQPESDWPETVRR